MTASSNSARPSSSRQPGNLGSKATAQAAMGDSPSINLLSSSQSSNSNDSIQQQLSKAQQLKAAR